MKNTTPIEAHADISRSTLAAENIIDVEELAELTDKPRRNPKRKCKNTLSGMDKSVPSYPPQERLESVEGHEEAPEPSEMTWTLSQFIQKIVTFSWNVSFVFHIAIYCKFSVSFNLCLVSYS